MPKSTNTEVVEIDPQSFRNMIYVFRDQQVMLDADLAAIYGYSTKAFNRQVKNNAEKFEEDFMFQLTDEEITCLRTKKLTSGNAKENLRCNFCTSSDEETLKTNSEASVWCFLQGWWKQDHYHPSARRHNTISSSY